MSSAELWGTVSRTISEAMIDVLTTPEKDHLLAASYWPLILGNQVYLINSEILLTCLVKIVGIYMICCYNRQSLGQNKIYHWPCEHQ
ncbi:hypothetical protein NDU88_001702 [Pleurodeles waltl]|uniref:Uncharacterized protein n=1 Tax=Pleurodeles waltl TaxID=8319 RepID=A0AAV7MNF4_PLEWA|nr:hypothetical protein NDU88_001702 [Pleurodeles waltl]